MEINKIEIAFMQKNRFENISMQGERHIKTLPYLSVVQSVKGSYDIEIGDSDTKSTGSGGFFIAPADVSQIITHNVDPETKTMTARWILLSVKLNGIYTLDGVYDLPVIVPKDKEPFLNRLFDRLFDSDNIFDEYVVYYEIARIIFDMSTEKKRKITPYTRKAIAYMKAHYREKITVSDIARETGLSNPRLFSIFKKETGVSPISFLNSYRLSLAAEALLQTDETVGRIADSVGIDDSVYFNKMFRKNYFMAPRKYRELYGSK